MSTRVILVRHDCEESWQYMPRVLQRIADFCAHYSPEEDGAQLAEVCKIQFLHPQPTFRIYAAIRDDVVVGHALVSVSEWLGSRWVTIHQYETDETLPVDVVRTHRDEIESWARSIGATEVRAIVASEGRVRAFGRFYGLKPWRMLLRRELGVA